MMERTLPRSLALPWGVIFNVIGITLLVLFWWRYGLMDPHLTADGAAYWGIRDGVLYEYGWLAETRGQPVPFVYSPAFAQLLAPLTLLPLPIFMAVWVGLNLGAIAWLVGPIPAALLVWLVPAVGQTNIWAGAVYPLMAFALALSLRYPSAWAFQVLTKVTPGIGVVWHLVRREWRALGWALGTTAGIVAMSVLLWPSAWIEWADVLRNGASREGYPPGALPIPLSVRLVLATGIVAFGAWRGWRWLLPVGIVLALPQVGLASLVLLLAIPRLSRGTRTRTH